MSNLATELDNAVDKLYSDCWKILFILVPPHLRTHLDNQAILGDEVQSAFPKARDDIKEAGNCIALERHTAAVFHLMRVAEYGLRALAYDRRVKILKGKSLDLATWEEIIRKLEKAEEAIQNYPQTKAREAQFEFYHGVMMECRRFKNFYRNRVSHTRESYDEFQALSAFKHVQAFMSILASRISEGKRTPKVWKGPKWAS